MVTSDAAHPSLPLRLDSISLRTKRKRIFLQQSPDYAKLGPLPLPVLVVYPLGVSPWFKSTTTPSILTDPDSALSLATKWLIAASPHSTSFSRLSLPPPLYPYLFDYSSYRPNLAPWTPISSPFAFALYDFSPPRGPMRGP
jgi:hypothetical protein